MVFYLPSHDIVNSIWYKKNIKRQLSVCYSHKIVFYCNYSKASGKTTIRDIFTLKWTSNAIFPVSLTLFVPSFVLKHITKTTSASTFSSSCPSFGVRRFVHDMRSCCYPVKFICIIIYIVWIGSSSHRLMSTKTNEGYCIYWSKYPKIFLFNCNYDNVVDPSIRVLK